MLPYSHRWMVAAAIACFVAAYALTPSEVRSSAGDRRVAVAVLPRLLPSPRIAALTATGDPFVPQVADEPGTVATNHQRPAVDVDALPGVGPLPANAGASSSSLLFAVRRDAQVSAVALGSHPTALIVEDGDSHLVSVGASVIGATVTQIDADGVRLNDGRLLALPASRAR